MTPPTLDKVRPTLTFEISYWEKAEADFITYLNIKENINQSKTKEIFKDVSTIGQAISAIKESQEKCEGSYGDKAAKVFKNMHYFLDLGDLAVKGGPESVGIVWMSFKVIFAGIQKDYKACQLLGDISSTALGLMIQCRVYGAMFDYRENPTQDETGALGEVQQRIQAAYLGILKFSYRAKTYIKRHKFLRGVKAIVIDPNFKIDAESIDELGVQLRQYAGIVLQRTDAKNQELMLKNDQYLIEIAEFQLQENRAAFKTLEAELSQIAEEVHAVKLDVEFIKDKMTDAEQERLLEKLQLHCASGAAFGSYEDQSEPKLLEGTRVEILRQIQDWCDDHSENGIFWLNGIAGTGKSTISRRVAEDFASIGCLGASFFFKRGRGDRGHAAKLFTTLAFQLTKMMPDLAHHICDAIKQHSDIGQQSLLNQWKNLILQPLLILDKRLFESLVLVFVIDALDECEGGEDDEDLRTMIIRLFNQAKDLKMIQLRVFITSRPEGPIRISFNRPDIVYRELRLHDIPVEHDISIFLRHELAKVNEKHYPGKDWPGEERIQELLRRADRLFIYAAIVCRFICKSRFPEKCVAKMLQVDSASHSSREELDKIYTRILNDSISEACDEEKEDIVKLFERIVGSIIILFDSLSTTALTELLAVPSDEMKETLEPLHSVLDIPQEQTSPIKLFHLSFRDFLLDRERCLDIQFWVHEKKAHRSLVESCLKAMSTLRMDICGLKKPDALASEVERSWVDQCLPDYVQYACRYWIDHLQKSDIELCDNGQVHAFLKGYFLHWLEALSLIGKMSEGRLMVTKLLSMVSSSKFSHSQLLEVVYEMKRFILYNNSIIEKAPLQLYTSALIFSPKTSWIRRHFLPKDLAWIESLPIIEENWSYSLETLEGNTNPVRAVAFSPDSRVLASGSDDKTVRLWDTETGALQKTLQGHSGSVGAVAFMPSSRVLASGSFDGMVWLWDAKTGALQKTLEGHLGLVTAMAFSPDSRILASASDDKTIRLWHAETGALQKTLEGHLSAVCALAFSSDSRVFASGSDDETIRLWDAKTGALQQTLEGHLNAVKAVAFSPDSRVLVSASTDKTVRLWDAKTGAWQKTLEGYSGWAWALAFSPSGQVLASTSNYETIQLWDAKTGALQKTLEGHSSTVEAITFSPNGRVLASGSTDETVRLWDAETGALQKTLEGNSGRVWAVVFSPSGQVLTSGSSDSTVRLWDAETGALQKTLEGHSGSVWAVAFSPNGRTLASTSDDSTVRLWDTETGALQKTLKGHSGRVGAVAFSPDGLVLASGSDDKTIRLWDAKTGALQKTLEGDLDWVWAVAFSPDDQVIASGSSNSTVQLWDAKTGALQMTLEGHSDSVAAVAFMPSSRVLASGSNDKTIRLWDTKTGVLQKTLEGHSSLVWAIAFSPSGRVLVSGSVDKTVRLWDTKTGVLQKTLEGHSDWVGAVAFSPSSQVFASGSSDRTIRLWDAATGALQKMLNSHPDRVGTMAFSPSSQVLVSRSNNKTVQLWDIKTGALQKTLEGISDLVGVVAFSSDGWVLVSGSSDGVVCLWDAETGALQKTLEGHSSQVGAVAFSPDSRVLASGSDDETIRLWDAETGALQKTLEGHLSIVGAIAFSPDSQVLASGSFNGTVRLWDAETGALQKTLEGHLDAIRAIAFSPDGRVLASGSSDKTVRLWDTETKSLLKDFIIGITTVNLSFSNDGSRLTTDIGSIELGLVSSHLIHTTSWSYSLNKDRSWIMWKGYNVLWLPPEYRPECQMIQDNVVAMGHSSGRTTIIGFKPDVSPI